MAPELFQFLGGTGRFEVAPGLIFEKTDALANKVIPDVALGWRAYLEQ